MMAYCRWTKYIEGNPPEGQQLVLYTNKGEPQWNVGIGSYSTNLGIWCVYNAEGIQMRDVNVLYYTDASEFTETMQWVIGYDSVKEDLHELLKDAKVTYHYDWRFWKDRPKREVAEIIIFTALLIGNLMFLVAHFLVGFGVWDW